MASGALGFLGGPIGLVTTALTLGAVAWSLWGNNADDALQKTRDLAEGLNLAADRIERAASGVTGDSGLIEQADAELERLRSQAEALQNQIDQRTNRLRQTIGAGAEQAVLGVEAAAVEELGRILAQVSELEQARDRLSQGLASQPQQEAPEEQEERDGTLRIRQRLQLRNLNVDLRNSYRDLSDTIRDNNQAEREAARAVRESARERTQADRDRAREAVRVLRVTMELADINEGLEQSYKDLAEAIEANNTPSNRLAEAFRELAEDAGSFGNISQLVASGVRDTEDAFVQLATTGKLSFGNLAQSVIADLVRILFRIIVVQNALRALASAFGGGGGFLGAAFLVQPAWWCGRPAAVPDLPTASQAPHAFTAAV